MNKEEIQESLNCFRILGEIADDLEILCMLERRDAEHTNTVFELGKVIRSYIRAFHWCLIGMDNEDHLHDLGHLLNEALSALDRQTKEEKHTSYYRRSAR